MSNLILTNWAKDPRLPQLQFRLKRGPWYLRGSYLPPGEKTRKWFEQTLESRDFNVNGKGHYTAPQDVLQKATIKLGEIYGRPVEAAGVEYTVGYFVTKAMKDQEDDLPLTYARDKYAEKHLKKNAWLWELPIHQLTEQTWKKYVARNPDRKLYNERRVLRHAIREAVRVPAVAIKWPQTPKLKLKKWHVDSDVGREIRDDEIEKILKACHANDALTYRYYRIMVPLALETGQRHEECCELERGHLDLTDMDAAEIRYNLGETKDGAARVLNLSREMALELKKHLLTHTSRFVFPSPKDPEKPLRRDNSTWRRIKADVEVDCRFHDIRHRVASELIRAGFAPDNICARLGMSPKTLRKIYSHLDEATKRAMAAHLREKFEALRGAWGIGE